MEGSPGVVERVAALHRVDLFARVPGRVLAEEWTADIASDPDEVWRSPWLATCARHAGRTRPA